MPPSSPAIRTASSSPPRASTRPSFFAILPEYTLPVCESPDPLLVEPASLGDGRHELVVHVVEHDLEDRALLRLSWAGRRTRWSLNRPALMTS